MPDMIKVLNNSYPTKMVCECETLAYFGTTIHIDNGQDMLCGNHAYIKFEVGMDGVWLCAPCLGHVIAFQRNPQAYEITEVK